ncbi:MAG TPA: ThiF family adenylyltransferase [Thermoplasmata archaeon]|nr:ThiF family adenylyltransferase [Thermoplasmata archaeon]
MSPLARPKDRRGLRRPRTKTSLSPYRLPSGKILLARDVFGLGSELADDRAGTVWRLLELMDGSRDLAAIHRTLARSHPGRDRATVGRAVEALRRIGVVEEGAGTPHGGLDPKAQDRYSRNLEFFSLVTVGSDRPPAELQQRLHDARVTVLGLGAIGSATAMSLVALGVGRIRILDHDRVERSNLNRQLLYTTRDIGRLKVTAARDRLRALNPDVEVVAERCRVRGPSDLLPLLRDTDLFVLGADQPHEILTWTNDAALRTGTPWLDNSYAGPRVALALFVPGRTPCLRCLQHYLERRLRRQGAFEGTELFPPATANAVIAPTAGIAGHLGALHAMYFLTGLPTPAEGRLLQVNLWSPKDVRLERPPFWRQCPACGSGRAGRPRSRVARPRPRPASGRRSRRRL